MTSSRQRIWIALTILLLLAFALWWWRQASESPQDASAESRSNAQLAGKRPIGADSDAKDDAVAKARWQDQRASVAGTVRDEGGAPLANADVCAWVGDDDVPSSLRREPTCTKTGKDGTYVIGELMPVRVSVHASAPTFIPNKFEVRRDRDEFELHPGEARKGVDIVLAGGGVALRGVVKDVAGGVIEGAIVQNETWSWNGSGTNGRGLTRSDDKGEFTLWVAPGNVFVNASAEGYAGGSAQGPVPGYTFEVLMTPESVLAGVVVRAGDGTPVAGVQVHAGNDWSSGFGFGGGSGTAVTDENGRFRIDRLAPGRFKPSAHGEDGYGRAAESVHLGLGQSAEDLRIEFHAAITVRGKVVIRGEPQQPCAHGSVSLHDKPGQQHAWAQTRDDGSVEMKAVLPGTYDVSVDCDGMIAEERYEPIVVGTAPIAELVWEVHEGLAITGIVLDPNGAPVPDARVSAQAKSAPPRGQVSHAWGERTGADGRFRLEGLLPGVYAVGLDVDGKDLVAPAEPTDVTLEPGATPDVRLTVEAAGSVHGRVVDSNGKTVANASVSLRGDEQGWGGRGQSGDDGTFTIPGVRPGRYRATAARGWGNAMRAPGTTDDDVQGERVEVSAGDTAEVELVVEDQHGTIRGRVLDETGGPVDDAFVHANRETDSKRAVAGGNRRSARWGGWDKKPVLTDQDGAFELADVATGKHTLFATRRGGGEGTIEHVEVGSKDVVIRIAPGARISGTVAVAGGGAPTRFTVTALERASGSNRNEEFYETGGKWVLDDLAPGKYEVSVEARQGSDMEKVEVGEGEQKAGVKLELAPKVSVEGTVVDADTGEPVVNVSVSINARRGNMFSFGGDEGGDKQHVSDAAGKFVVHDAPTGKVRITFMPRAWGDQTYDWSFVGAVIPSDVERHSLGTIEIVKTRIQDNKAAGDLGLTLKDAPPDVDAEDSPLEVAFIRPGGPAAATELAIGDVITAVDGKDVTGNYRHRWRTLTRVPQGTKVTLDLANGKSIAIVAAKPP